MINILELSIIVPVYNAAKTISLTIDSILSQTFKDFELIIVNDGAVDDSEFVIKKYRDNRIRYFYKSNGGVSSTRNYGLDKALGNYLNNSYFSLKHVPTA